MRTFIKNEALKITKLSNSEFEYFTTHRRGKHNRVLLDISNSIITGPGYPSKLSIDQLVDLKILKLMKDAGMKLSKMGRLIDKKEDVITHSNDDESLSLCIYRNKIKQQLLEAIT